MGCSAEEPGGTLLDGREISMEESQKSMQYSQKRGAWGGGVKWTIQVQTGMVRTLI